MSIVQYLNNRAPSVTDTIRVAGSPFDLTGCTVKFKMRLETSSTLKVDAAATIINQAAGTVRYDWAAADVNTAGEYVAWWEVTLTTGYKQDTAEFAISVVEHAQASANLCSLADVREALQLPVSDRGRDELIRTLIPAASRAISVDCQREFAPATASATRTFGVSGTTVSLQPWSLRSVATVTVDPEGSATVLSSDDYLLTPVHKPFGVYDTMLIYPSSVLHTDTRLRFGVTVVEIDGAWGFASIPSDVRQAAVICVTSWLRRDIQTFALPGELDDPSVIAEPSFSVPPAAKRLLAPYRKAGVF